MRFQIVQRFLIASCAVGFVLVALEWPQGLLGSRRDAYRQLLPGKPLPSAELGNLFATPAPVRRVTDALVEPIEEAAQRLRPYARMIFPALWEEPKPTTPQPYSVRDTALKVVRETL